jgi:hypothetical protein
MTSEMIIVLLLSYVFRDIIVIVIGIVLLFYCERPSVSRGPGKRSPVLVYRVSRIEVNYY